MYEDRRVSGRDIGAQITEKWSKIKRLIMKKKERDIENKRKKRRHRERKTEKERLGEKEIEREREGERRR